MSAVKSFSNSVSIMATATPVVNLEADNEEREQQEVSIRVYGDIHRRFLQGIMAAGYLDAKNVKKLYQIALQPYNIGRTEDVMRDIQILATVINEEIRRYDMIIGSVSCEITGVRYFMFWFNVEKPVMRLQTMFSKAEMQLLQRIITEVLLHSPTFSVAEADCLNFHREIKVKGFNLEAAESFIQQMLSTKYLIQYEEGGDSVVSIGFRLIREFEHILKEMYEGVMIKCFLCKSVALHGLLCRNCGEFVHRACYKKYTRNCRTCPTCKCRWEDAEMKPRVRTAKESGSGPAQSQSTEGNSGEVETDRDEPASDSTENNAKSASITEDESDKRDTSAGDENEDQSNKATSSKRVSSQRRARAEIETDTTSGSGTE